MKYFKKIIFCLMLLSAFLLSACGRYSDPSPIQGSGFPHNYPND